GWYVAIGVPRDAIEAPFHTAQFIAFGGGAATVALSFILAWWFGLAIRRPVAALTALARALGSGAARPEVPIHGVRELELVGDALGFSADELEQKERARAAAEAALR